MATPRVARAAQLAAQLRGAGIGATHDPGAVAAAAPCVLVPPPRLTFDTGGGPTVTWRLVAVAATAVQLDAWGQLDDLVDRVEALLPVELAEPVAWQPTPDATPMPAYALTITE